MSEKTEQKKLLDKLQKKILAEMKRIGPGIPYIVNDGVYNDMRYENISWWTNGFWAGILWQLYGIDHDERYKNAALLTDPVLDKALDKFTGLHHDVGFQFLLTAVANYRLCNDERAADRALHAATLLAGRFNPAGKFIRAWNRDRTGWIIVDTLMNLPLLWWASEKTGDPRFAYIAKEHATTSMEILQRPDGSMHHIAVLDPENGAAKAFPPGQGYASGSSWSRGQAWAIYGFALAAGHSREIEFLNAAKRVAHYFLAQVIPAEYIARADFRAPDEPLYIDTSASACAACGLFEISKLVDASEKEFYEDAALNTLNSLLESECDWNPENDGILQNASSRYGREKDAHRPIIYGDYFLVEAILRSMGSASFLW